MSTIGEVIIDALSDAGIYDPEDTIPDVEIAKCLRKVNDLLDRWAMQGLTIFSRTEDTKVLTIGAGSYTIGALGAIATVWPVEIEQAFLRDLSGNDTSIDCSMTQEEYNAITNKTTMGIPSRLFYKKSFPLGIIYFDYKPDAAYTLHLFSKKSLTAFASVTDDFSAVVPTGYKAAITANLAIDLGEFYKRPPSQIMIARAEKTLELIKMHNYEPKKLPMNSCIGNQGQSGNIIDGWE
jgi:hypothetical protein